MDHWIIILSYLFFLAYAEKLIDLSFEPPYIDVGHSGAKTVNRHWRSHGDASVQTNFARIAPDRQSQVGALWSRRSTTSKALSVVTTFRIAGKGKTFFGDGLAFWLVTQGYYIEGDLHGFDDKFTGIAIIFDTFKNTDKGLEHRDVTVLVNDGEKTLDMMYKEGYGCDISVRYDAGQGDFNVAKSVSHMKYLADEDSIDIFIDARNTGEWTRCVKIEGLNLPTGWLSHSHIGVTATTGQLADNHDVISLLAFTEPLVMEKEINAKREQKLFPELFNSTVEQRFARYQVSCFK